MEDEISSQKKNNRENTLQENKEISNRNAH